MSILRTRHKKPIISFGLGLTLLSCEVGDTVTIYQNQIYNENEYFLNENESSEIITMQWRTFANTTPLTAIFNKVGIFNNRAYYNNTNSFLIGPSTYANVTIFWSGTQWLIVDDFNSIDGTYNEQIGWLNSNILRPVGDWQYIEYIFIPLSSTSNITNNKITFNATASKDIRIEVRNKNGIVLKSNKITLNVI